MEKWPTDGQGENNNRANNPKQQNCVQKTHKMTEHCNRQTRPNKRGHFHSYINNQFDLEPHRSLFHPLATVRHRIWAGPENKQNNPPPPPPKHKIRIFSIKISTDTDCKHLKKIFTQLTVACFLRLLLQQSEINVRAVLLSCSWTAYSCVPCHIMDGI